MRANFKAARPDEVEVSLTLTATVADWRRLRKSLEEGGPEAKELGKGVAHLIAQADANLATERWTSGYSTGVVRESA